MDSNHCARNCPISIDLYHGTRVSSIASIMQDHFSMKGGLTPTLNGRIGTGIYFTTK